MRAIVTFARGWNALAAVRSLGKKGIEVVTADEHPFAPASFSRYSIANFQYPNSDEKPAEFLDVLEANIRKHAPTDGRYVLMPMHRETYLIARHRKRFEPLIRTALPTIEQIETVHDKGKFAEFCRRFGYPMPRTELPRTAAEMKELAKTFPYPAFVKIRQASSSVGVKKVRTSRELIETWEKFVRDFALEPAHYPLIQEGVPGEDYCATFLFDRGRRRASMVYHNLRTWPPKSGTGVLRETVSAPEMERIGTHLLERLNWHGVAEIDFRWQGKDSPPWIIEMNPRFWGGLPQSIASGVDYPYLLFRLALEERLDPVRAAEPGARTELPLMALLSTLHEVIRDDESMGKMRAAYSELRRSFFPGNRRRALRTFLSRLRGAADLRGRMEKLRKLLQDHRGTVSDIFSWDDPLPALGIFYPLAVFLREGRVSLEALTSEGRRNGRQAR